jgi:hypothetical protein
LHVFRARLVPHIIYSHDAFPLIFAVCVVMVLK